MSGVFDRLNKKLGDQDDSGGISPVDLAKLPPVQRQIMRLLLRELDMKESEVKDALAEGPEDKRPTEAEFDDALKELTREGWVIRMGEGENITCRANLKRKAPSTLAKSIWAALDSRIEETKGGTKAE
jgi:hypothetical protein